MATLPILVVKGVLKRVDPVLPVRVFEERFLYVLPRAEAWLCDSLPELGSTWNLETLPDQQADALFERFCSGQELCYDQDFKQLFRRAYEIWELKTADLRFFGWFPKKDHFIISAVDTSENIKARRLYQGYIGQAVRDRDALDLDEPKFVPGDDINDIVSNFSFP